MLEYQMAEGPKVSESTIDFVYEFHNYKVMFWPCGLWPLDEENFSNAARYLLAVSTQVFAILSLTKEIGLNCGNAISQLENWALLSTFVLSFVKMVCIRLHLAKMRRACLAARKNWSEVGDGDERSIMESHARLGKKVYRAQMIVAYCIVFQYSCMPLYNPRADASNLPLQTVCTFRNLSSLDYHSVYLAEVVALSYLALGFIGIDIFFFTVVMHLCGQLHVLQRQFNAIGKSELHSDFVRLMSRLIKKHFEVIELAKDINITFGFILLTQFIGSTFLVTSQSLTFLLALRVDDVLLAFKCLYSFPILFLELLFYCYAGELLKYYFENTTNSMYDSLWYRLPPKLRKYYLVFAMACAGKPVLITAERMFQVDMGTFIKFVRITGSFFSILILLFDN